MRRVGGTSLVLPLHCAGCASTGSDSSAEASGEVFTALGPSLVAQEELAWCTVVTYRTDGSEATASIHMPERALITIQTPEGARTEQGIGAGSTLHDRTATYQAREVQTVGTQAGGGTHLAPADAPENQFGDPERLIGVTWDRVTLGPPMVGGLPGLGYCPG